MKLIQMIAVSTLVCPLVCLAQTVSSQSYTVPFYNATVQHGDKLIADYSFDPLHQTLVCKSSSMVHSAIHWKYKESEYGAILPAGGHLSFKAHKYPEGHFADPKGIINISNTYPDDPNKPQLIVSCEYHTWG